MVSCIFEPCTNRVLKIKAFATPVLAAVSYHSYLLYSSLQLEVSSFCLLVLNMPWGRMSSISKLRLFKQESRRSVHPPTSTNTCSFGGFAPYYTNRKKTAGSLAALRGKNHIPLQAPLELSHMIPGLKRLQSGSLGSRKPNRCKVTLSHHNTDALLPLEHAI